MKPADQQGCAGYLVEIHSQNLARYEYPTIQQGFSLISSHTATLRAGPAWIEARQGALRNTKAGCCGTQQNACCARKGEPAAGHSVVSNALLLMQLPFGGLPCFCPSLRCCCIVVLGCAAALLVFGQAGSLLHDAWRPAQHDQQNLCYKIWASICCNVYTLMSACNALMTVVQLSLIRSRTAALPLTVGCWMPATSPARLPLCAIQRTHVPLFAC